MLDSMSANSEQIERILAEAGIFGPGSAELALYESRLTRYFEREYKRLEAERVSLDDLGISTDEGPIMEETEALMDSHYDEKPEFFASFLDKKYQAYSMAYYGDTPTAICNSTASLEQAQQAKFALIAERAGIEGHERIFNIGCGFGSLETYLLEHYPNLEITGITPSKVQVAYLRQRMQDPADPLGSGRFKLVHGKFNRQLVNMLKTASYDIVVSVGTMEHSLNMREIHELTRRLLVNGGVSFHHFITSIQAIPQFLDPTKTKIGLYFPGGRVWPHDEFARHTEHFDLAGHWFVNGLNYWRTLDAWHRRFWDNIPELYGSVFDTDAIAHWNNYFSLCKAVFAPQDGNFYGNSHYLFKLRS
jgi:cyclopropane-fatty-acyl-phospholipid synthase